MLHHLRYVAIPGLNSGSLTKLLRVPHSLEWTELCIPALSAGALRNLPDLLTLDAWNCRDVSFLPALPRLQSLELQIEDDPWAVTGEALVEAILSCRQLTSLDLTAPVTSAHLSALLPRLPLLQSLGLAFCSELDSLAFLSDVSMLREFILDFQPALRTSELRHILGLKNLTKLRLLSSLSQELDEFTQHLLTPPSTLLPKLTSFKYEPAAAAVA